MLELARRHGASAETSAEEGVVRVVFRLQEPAGGGPGAGPPGRALPPVD
jgi:hypothetical protein